jgi:HSP20 family protein
LKYPDPNDYAGDWMLAEAVELLEYADRLRRQFFWIGQPGEIPSWEPPIDMYLNDGELCVLIALPGVAPERFEVNLEHQTILVRGQRSFDANTGSGAILRMEIPYGRFERRIPLPVGDFRLREVVLKDGCVRLLLERLA